ncbi:MAG TPA: TlpA disulfide reductase family protein [Saprospiraceae bacterium]|nr:TlpA disulfide reductase family protein [Saprospiraceae bacterium]HNT21711.1 TlpA disulfide reductase family protein [Saprospiraceae bacterium]
MNINSKFFPFALLFSAIALFWTCKQEEEGPIKTLITGEITGYPDGTLTIYRVVDEDSSRVDTFPLRDGKFEISLSDHEPRMANLVFPDGMTAVQFFTEAGTITMKGTREEAANLEVSGTPANELNKEMKAIYAGFEQRYNDLMEQATKAQQTEDQAALDTLEPLLMKFEGEVSRSHVDFAMKHPNTILSAYLGLSASMSPGLDLKPLYESLSDEVKNTFFGLRLKNVVESAAKTAIGSAAPDFEGISPDGKILRLSSLKGKHLLVDFWASWCMPCRQENPNVVRVYDNYKNKGFEILGVSLDQEKEKWVDAIAQDGLAWPQVSDLLGWKSKIAAMYGVQGIPQNFLLDHEGRIIAKGLRGQDLENKLKELLN